MWLKSLLSNVCKELYTMCQQIQKYTVLHYLNHCYVPFRLHCSVAGVVIDWCHARSVDSAGVPQPGQPKPREATATLKSWVPGSGQTQVEKRTVGDLSPIMARVTTPAHVRPITTPSLRTHWCLAARSSETLMRTNDRQKATSVDSATVAFKDAEWPITVYTIRSYTGCRE